MERPWSVRDGWSERGVCATAGVRGWRGEMSYMELFQTLSHPSIFSASRTLPRALSPPAHPSLSQSHHYLTQPGSRGHCAAGPCSQVCLLSVPAIATRVYHLPHACISLLCLFSLSLFLSSLSRAFSLPLSLQPIVHVSIYTNSGTCLNTATPPCV